MGQGSVQSEPRSRTVGPAHVQLSPPLVSGNSVTLPTHPDLHRADRSTHPPFQLQPSTTSSPSRSHRTRRRSRRGQPWPPRTSSTSRPSFSTPSTPTSTRTPSPPRGCTPSFARRAPPRPPASAKAGPHRPPTAPTVVPSAPLPRHARLRATGFHLSLLLPLALLPLALLLPPPRSPAALLAPLLPLAFLFIALLPQVVLASPPRPAHLVAALLAATVLSSSPFAGSVASLPAWRSARAFWFGTDQPRTGLAVLASSAPTRLLLHLVVLVSSAASILQCCGFVDGPELEVKLLAAAAGLQLLASSTPRAVHIPAHVPACLAAASQRGTSPLLQASRRLDLDRRRASSLLP
ncbi:hypothetical protein ZWY2020_006634 [Hordeum vulgare]|nr:hypothetical protein ZWY2020_006634 [Hordeum vulgare]